MECGVLVCGMLHNAMYMECCLSGKLRCDVNVEVWNCGGDECGICNALCDCCVMSDVENDAMCCDVRCGGVSNAMWNMVWCKICNNVECGYGVE